MCGIVGLYRPELDERSQICSAMLRALKHRGPDDFDTWVNDTKKLSFGHHRLAIIDLSPDGKQPMHSTSGRFTITYNGEIYNYQRLKLELQEQGQKFQTQTDTEVILASIECWGFEKALQKLNGMFAFAVWDQKEQKLFLARDRFGKKPLYLGWFGKDFAFSSELKSFHAHPDFKPEINPNNLGLYMQYSYLKAPHCIFKNIWQLPAANYAVIDFEKLKPQENLCFYFKNYWNLSEIVNSQKKSSISEEQAFKKFEELLEQCVRDRMLTSDVPLGAFLSGGIDSSTVVALMQKIVDQPVKTFSIGFDNSDYNEAQKSKKIAKHLGTDHREFYVSPQDVLDVIPSLPDIYDEPFADSSQIPTHLISKLAREHVTVALTGDGGDEILGGYERHTHVARLWDKTNRVPHVFRKIGAQVLKSVPQNIYNHFGTRLGEKIYRSADLISLNNSASVYESLLMSWPNAENVALNANIPSFSNDNLAPNLSFAEQMMLGDCLSYRTDDLMVKADRASMAVALELRAPLMDYELAEFCWSLPQSMKIKGSQGKWLLRQVQKKYIPEEITKGPKQHFGLPLKDWLKGDLKEWGSDLLAKDRLKNQGFLNADLVSQAWQDYQGGHPSVSEKALWTALMFQIWVDRWL